MLDFTFLLDNLRIIAKNYYLDDKGIVVNKNKEEINDEIIVLNAKFCNLYCQAYKEVAEVFDNYPVDLNDREFLIRALSDYNVFNSFIKNCVFEYNMYKRIGTGYIMYTPYSPLSDYFFKDSSRKKVLMDYLSSELSDVFNHDKKNKGVRK